MDEELNEVHAAELSPLPEAEENGYSTPFCEALESILTGKRMRRKEWPEGEYGYFDGDFLNIFKDGREHRWILSKGDIIEEDYIVF